MPHYNMHAHLAEMPLTGERLTVLDGTAPDIQDIMRRCDLFLTDHSSVHFDIAYLGTPLIYTHFDDDEYFGGHAHTSWFSHERDGFGPVTRDVESTIDAIEHYVLNDCVREPAYTARVAEAFIFHDRNNSRRAVAAIENLLRTHGIS
jgi:CDP-glycerol glycerophosphotransferase (TagB/SpsB family)